MTNEKTTDEKDPSGSYTLDMDDIESMGNLADLDIESFLSGGYRGFASRTIGSVQPGVALFR